MTCFSRGPVNEDVFAAPVYHGGKMMDSDIQEISEQIHRLLLQVCKRTRLESKHTGRFIRSAVSLTDSVSSAGPQHGLQRVRQPRQQRVPRAAGQHQLSQREQRKHVSGEHWGGDGQSQAAAHVPGDMQGSSHAEEPGLPSLPALAPALAIAIPIQARAEENF